MDWESSPLSSRFKAFENEGKKARLVEIIKGAEADWCQTGHIGYVIEGELEIEFKDETLDYKKGDGIFIAAGETEEHKPRPISERVVLFLVEEN